MYELPKVMILLTVHLASLPAQVRADSNHRLLLSNACR